MWCRNGAIKVNDLMGKKDFKVSDDLHVSSSFCFENSSSGFNSLQRDIFGTSTLCMS